MQDGYLAVRSLPEATSKSEKAGLYEGDEVQIAGGVVQGTGFEGEPVAYVWVYVSRLDVYGYVNSGYLE